MLGAGAGVVEVVVGVVVVVPGSVVGPVLVVVLVLVVGSVLAGGVFVVAGADEVVVVKGATVAFGSVVAPAVPAAATLGVVDWPRTVGSVCVCVRPGSGVGLAFGLVVVVPAVCLAAILSGDFLVVAEAFLAGAALCGCLTTAGWAMADTPPVTCGVVVAAAAIGCAGTDATTALGVAA